MLVLVLVLKLVVVLGCWLLSLLALDVGHMALVGSHVFLEMVLATE